LRRYLEVISDRPQVQTDLQLDWLIVLLRK
jgi:hypothetical protein